MGMQKKNVEDKKINVYLFILVKLKPKIKLK